MRTKKKQTYGLQNKQEERAFFDRFAPTNDVVLKSVYEKISLKCHQYLKKFSGDVLEAGCGTGEFGRHLALFGHSVHGIDISSKMVKLANLSRPMTYKARTGDLDDRSLFPARRFSLVLCPGILHHFPDLTRSPIVSNINYWLRPGGYLICWEPNGSHPINRLSKLVGKVLHLDSKKGIATSNETNHSFHTYHKVFSELGLRQIVATSFSDKSTAKFASIVITLLVEIRWLLLKLMDITLPFPHSGCMIFLVYQKPK